MATPSKLVKPPQWWKHLRNFAGKQFWKRERRAYDKEIKREQTDEPTHKR